jgi:hypothetical protein
MVCQGAAFAGGINQSHFAGASVDDFQVVVPLKKPNDRVELWHFFHDNRFIGSQWQAIGRITEVDDQVVGPASIIQSDFGDPNHNFEVVVPLIGPNGHAELWHFFRNNSLPRRPWAKVQRITRPDDVISGPGSIIQSEFGDSRNFEVVVPIKGPRGHAELWHFFHDNSVVGPWTASGTVTESSDAVAAGGMILQSDFGGAHDNLEVIVPLHMPHGHIELRHFWRDTSWHRGDLITASARRGPGGSGVAFLRSDFHEGDHHNFEALVEEGKRSIVHYFRHNARANPWLRTVLIFDPPRLLPEEAVPKDAGPHKICQLTGEYDLEGWHKAITGEASEENPALASHDGRLFLAWKGTDDKINLMISDDAGATFHSKRTLGETSSHAPALTSHNGRLFLAWKGSGNDKLNVAQVILFASTAGAFGIEGLKAKVTLGEMSKAGPALISHSGRLFLAWKGSGNDKLNVAKVILFASTAGTFGIEGLEAKVTLGEMSQAGPALASHDGRLFLAWKGIDDKINLMFSDDAGATFRSKKTLGETSSHAPALTSQNGRLFLTWKGLGNTDLNLLVSDDNAATFHGKPRVSAVPKAPSHGGGYRATEASSAALALASNGEALIWAWKGSSNDNLNVARFHAPDRTQVPFGSAHNRTESQAGLVGTDLGTSFIHSGRICFLFGDTARLNEPVEDRNLDAIAFAALGQNPTRGLDLTFNRQPPRIQGMAESQKEFEVPLDGVSFGGSMFVYFSDGSRSVTPTHMHIERSIVARSGDDGLNFSFLREFSHHKFVNVSLDQAAGSQVGLPTFGRTLLIWGTGRYRSSDVYLAAMPLEEIASGRFVRYYAGNRQTEPIWAEDEEQAVPLFQDGSVGELSVRWNPFIARWMMMYLSANPAGVLIRLAGHPWGVWSYPRMVFPVFGNEGLGTFMHRPNNDPGGHSQLDWLYDHLQGPDPDDDPANRQDGSGLPYAPGLIAPLIQGMPDGASNVFFTLSIWNPYQVILMSMPVAIGEFSFPPSPQRVSTRTAVIPRLRIRGTTPF